MSSLPTIAVGETIEFDLMPGFPMEVLDTKDCETDSARPEPHLTYKVVDPEGNEDWLCGHDVHRVSGGGRRG